MHVIPADVKALSAAAHESWNCRRKKFSAVGPVHDRVERRHRNAFSFASVALPHGDCRVFFPIPWPLQLSTNEPSAETAARKSEASRHNPQFLCRGTDLSCVIVLRARSRFPPPEEIIAANRFNFSTFSSEPCRLRVADIISTGLENAQRFSVNRDLAAYFRSRSFTLPERKARRRNRSAPPRAARNHPGH